MKIMKKFPILAVLVFATMFSVSEAVRAENGEASAWQFVENRMLDANGVVHYLASPGGNSSNAVVESMGQAMEYLALAGDAESFARFADATDRYFKDARGYYYWQIDLATGQPSRVTALIDDLRLFRALYTANEKGLGDYTARLRTLAGDIYDFDVNDSGYPVSNYDESSDTKASSVNLFYLDVDTMGKMASSDPRWQEPFERGRTILLQMPESAYGFYPPRFNVRNKQYASRSQANMVENLYTAIFARDAGRDASAFARFLMTQVAGGKIYNVYDESGGPVHKEGESTAVYALAARFLEGSGEKEAAKWCRDRFLSSQIATGTFAGGFSMDTDQSVYAFDQLEALLALRTLPSYANGGETGGGGGGGCDTGGALVLSMAVLCAASVRRKFVS